MNAPSTNIDTLSNENSFHGYLPRMFQMHGRIGRLRYIVYSLSVVLLFYGMAYLGFELLPRLIVDASLYQKLSLVMLLITLVLACAQAVFTTRRLNDLNVTGWAVIVALVPMINLIFTLFLAFAPGSAGDNRYGQPPLPNGRNVHFALTSMILGCLLIFVLVGINGGFE